MGHIFFTVKCYTAWIFTVNCYIWNYSYVLQYILQILNETIKMDNWNYRSDVTDEIAINMRKKAIFSISV